MVGKTTFLWFFCGFWSVAVNTMDKLQFLDYIYLFCTDAEFGYSNNKDNKRS